MKIPKSMIVVGITLILFITMACSLGAKNATPEPIQPGDNTMVTDSNIENATQIISTMDSNQQAQQVSTPTLENAASEESPFPVTDDATNITKSADSVNFQTGMSINDAIEYYRQLFTSQDLTENTLLTAITDSTFSMVFEGSSNGRSLVIQGVDLGSGSTNINIRYEDL